MSTTPICFPISVKHSLIRNEFRPENCTEMACANAFRAGRIVGLKQRVSCRGEHNFDLPKELRSHSSVGVCPLAISGRECGFEVTKIETGCVKERGVEVFLHQVESSLAEGWFGPRSFPSSMCSVSLVYWAASSIANGVLSVTARG